MSFLRETENLGFMEAVERLAREAGMAMPSRDPAAAQVADQRSRLHEVMEAAVNWFRLQLRTAAAAEARAYLARRGLSPDAQARWEIGFAPDARHGLVQAMAQKGIGADLLVEAGLCARPDDGGAPYDRFRGRIIFPIRDGRGKAISLGGRAMDPNARAKYLNGPETALFDKGRNLFNFAPAREAAGKGRPLIVAEGYMDVIALSEAGFTAAVAPLGTAVTADQLGLMWRISPEPVIALDGDAAGIRAALRVIDLALPLLEAGKALRFAVLPQGQDPDDLIRTEGAAAMQRVIEAAQPMVRLLWQREIDGKVFDSPERKAALDKALRLQLSRIADPSIRSHYVEDLRRLRLDLFGQSGARPFQPGPRPGLRPAGGIGAAARRGLPAQDLAPVATSKASALAAASAAAVEERLLAGVLLATFLTHPALVGEFERPLETLELDHPDHRRICDCLLRSAAAPERLAALVASDCPDALERLMSDRHVRSAPPVRKPADRDLARRCVAEGLAKLEARRGLRMEIADAQQDVLARADEGLTWRLGQAAEALNRAERPRLEDAAELGEDRQALSRHLQDLIDSEIWKKKKH
jgi:DNA primase